VAAALGPGWPSAAPSCGADRHQVAQAQQPQQQPSAPSGRKPNILVIWGDDIGLANISAYSRGLMSYQTPNIDRIGREDMMFMDYYAEQSCPAKRLPAAY
jgi:arylsulfatase